MIAMIDNYDSFTYNIVQELREMEADLRVFRNDAITVDALDALAPAALVVSPGPGRPSEAGISMDAIRRFAGRIPILGVCLGHQAICAVYGATITYAKQLMHGKQSEVHFDSACPLFSRCPENALVARYHSLAADPDTIPDCLRVTATTKGGEIMAVQHKIFPVYGVQFHPESILTPDGKTILKNFLVG